MKAVKIRLTMSVGRKRKKSRLWRGRIRRRGPRNAVRWSQGTTDQLGRSRRRSHQGSEMMFNFRSHRWNKELLLSSSRVWNALHVSSARTRSEWARSFWIVECCSASRIARDLRRRRWAWTINRLLFFVQDRKICRRIMRVWTRKVSYMSV